MPSSYAVLGAGGPAGQACVSNLLERVPDAEVLAVVRDPTKYQDVLPSKAKLVAGDVTSVESLRSCIPKGCKGVIFAASGRGFWSADAVDHQGVANAATAAKEAGAERMVLITSQFVTPKNRFNPIRIILNNMRWGLMDAKYAGENALRSSGLPYTIVRPGQLSRAPGGKRILTGQGDTGVPGGGAIPRADVAAVCVEALLNPAARNVTVEVSGSKAEPGPLDNHMAVLKSIFNGLKPDA